ncbi:MAG: Rpn family recombination-promoting nuclease/putative transposase [Chitinispirillales bacterium]|nr:Rpn family recombination-promoting nuclease/putative transposase [Chitinispirillales bacterium]
MIELYNALFNTHYGPDTPIEITTLEEAIYRNVKNDVSFVIDGKVVILIEHQSTINENIPLRMVSYAARVYEKLYGGKDKYRKERMQIPHCEFIVLYNGAEDIPDDHTFSLSDMYIKSSKKNPMGKLELEVKVLNINKGRNVEIAKRSKTLSDYETFIAVIRKHQKKTDNLDEAVKLAVKECIKRSILKGFLQTHATEIEDMIFGEWDSAEELKVAKEEGKKEGVIELARLIQKGVPLPEAMKKLGIKPVRKNSKKES